MISGTTKSDFALVPIRGKRSGRTGKSTTIDYAIVDGRDFSSVSEIRWHRGTYGYATNKNGRTVTAMHRLVTGAVGRWSIVDHRNHDRMDNRRCNLRIVTQAQNGQHRRTVPSNNKTGHLGVSYDERFKRPWRASVGMGGKTVYWKHWSTLEEAAKDAAQARARLGFMSKTDQ